MHELDRSNFRVSTSKMPGSQSSCLYFIHELTGDGKIINWYVKKINDLNSMSCVTNSFLELPCLFGNKQETRFQMKKIITFSDIISGTWNTFFRH